MLFVMQSAHKGGHMINIRVKVWFEKNGKLVFGKGRYDILNEIDKTHSINKAAENMDLSFRHVWSHIDTIEKNLGVALVHRERGGKGGGSSSLTPQAKELMKEYHRLEKEIKEFAESRFKELFKWKASK